MEKTTLGENSDYPKHQSELCRLNRTLGQIEGIKKMIIDERYCVEIMTQLKAVRAALKNIEVSILATHMQNCLEKAVSSNEKGELAKKIGELRELIKKFD